MNKTQRKIIKELVESMFERYVDVQHNDFIAVPELGGTIGIVAHNDKMILLFKDDTLPHENPYVEYEVKTFNPFDDNDPFTTSYTTPIVNKKVYINEVVSIYVRSEQNCINTPENTRISKTMYLPGGLFSTNDFTSIQWHTSHNHKKGVQDFKAAKHMLKQKIDSFIDGIEFQLNMNMNFKKKVRL